MTDKSIYDICLAVASNSKCLSRKIGAVLVRNGCIISTGTNGPPRKIHHCGIRHRYDTNLRDKYLKYGILKEFDLSIVGRVRLMEGKPIIHGYDSIEFDQCPRRLLGYKSGEGIDLCVAAHAEENAILNCTFNNINLEGSVMFMTCSIPCAKCLVKILQVGIKELVVSEYKYYDESSEFLVKDSKLEIRKFDFMD